MVMQFLNKCQWFSKVDVPISTQCLFVTLFFSYLFFHSIQAWGTCQIIYYCDFTGSIPWLKATVGVCWSERNPWWLSSTLQKALASDKPVCAIIPANGDLWELIRMSNGSGRGDRPATDLKFCMNKSDSSSMLSKNAARYLIASNCFKQS